MRGKLQYVCEREARVGDWGVIYGLWGYVLRWGQIVDRNESDFGVRIYDNDNKNQVNEFLRVQYWNKNFVEVFATQDEAYNHFREAYKIANSWKFRLKK